jgi:hypothetical protein
MAPTIPPSTGRFRLHSVDPRQAPLFCFGLLTISCALASFALACATPLAAFAVVAAATLSLRPALSVVAGAWFVNQTIGFGALHYPVDASTIAWGLVIGFAALAATAASTVALRAVPRMRWPLALGLALLCAYGVYETALFAATAFLGGAEAFTPDIVGRLGLLNVAWLIGLVAACEIVRLLNPFRLLRSTWFTRTS